MARNSTNEDERERMIDEWLDDTFGRRSQLQNEAARIVFGFMTVIAVLTVIALLLAR